MNLANLFLRIADRRPPDFVIGDPSNPYLRRWWVIPRNRWFNVYLHHFLRDDDDRALHDHPWHWCSILLSGGYVEHTIAAGGVHHRRERQAPSIKFSRAARAHRVELLKLSDFVATQPDNDRPVSCWTLFITGPAFRTWGFHCPERGWVPWQQFLNLDNPGVVGKGCEP